MVPGEPFGSALRRLRHERGVLSMRQFAASVHYSPAYISEVERGVKRATAELAQRCDDELQAKGLLVVRAQAERNAPDHGEDAATSSRPEGREDDEERPLTAREVAMAAAHESTAGSATDGSQSMPDMSVEQIQDDIRHLARTYNEQPPLSALIAARRLRDMARTMAEHTHKPRQLANLYEVAGQACGVMAIGSFDLSIWPAATEQARATLVYSDLIEASPLRAWAHGAMAMTAFWSGHPREAADYATRGLRDCPPGTARARLLCISARAWSYLGDPERTRAAIDAADQERQAIGEAGDDELHDQIAGEFGWGPARHAMCDAASWLRLGQADEASDRARTAIELRAQDRTGSLVEAKATVDLASAELMRDNSTQPRPRWRRCGTSPATAASTAWWPGSRTSARTCAATGTTRRRRRGPSSSGSTRSPRTLRRMHCPPSADQFA
ncbi:helix-turn-helix protein [Haloactinopolyspora alba]|uniref:Helix-turn-helix protein n=1 Tax=Haloactinopolyspora alba TaxID=648780 RepID=A0A2P8DM60_9ACTN|nr:helix-turn-helix transcriptional regulator [Haloactinopolyspora alba]PSK98294.1 helix-turn-helix protein [Haloactinopolyspora alba]